MPKPISQARLKELLDYDPATGIFTAKTKRKRGYVGMPVGYKRYNGHVVLPLDGGHYFAHRMAWLFVHGHEPDGPLDHINRDGSDNRIENLRPATLQANNRNTRIRRHNQSGYKGVVLAKHCGRWRARIAGRQLGYFDTPEQACAAYEAAARELHGEFFCPETRATDTAPSTPAPTTFE